MTAKLLSALFTLILLSGQVWAGESLPAEQDAIKAILGEAGQSDQERLAIAFAIVNRGHLKGVYGRLEAPSAVQWQKGARAWHTALNGLENDPTHGADHWLSDYDLAHARKALTAFRFKMVETAYIGTTHFYKEK